MSFALGCFNPGLCMTYEVGGRYKRRISGGVRSRCKELPTLVDETQIIVGTRMIYLMPKRCGLSHIGGSECSTGLRESES